MAFMQRTSSPSRARSKKPAKAPKRGRANGASDTGCSRGKKSTASSPASSTQAPPTPVRSRLEHHMQSAVVAWATAEAISGRWPELHLLFAVPNGGRRSARAGADLKREGLKPGVPDLCLPIARGGYFGLWIEMKTPKGRVSAEQAEWHANLVAQNHRVFVARSAQDAVNVIADYLRSGATSA